MSTAPQSGSFFQRNRKWLLPVVIVVPLLLVSSCCVVSISGFMIIRYMQYEEAKRQAEIYQSIQSYDVKSNDALEARPIEPFPTIEPREDDSVSPPPLGELKE